MATFIVPPNELNTAVSHSSDVVIMIHGTWGRGIFLRSNRAPWCESNSLICTSISRALSTSPTFISLQWSGRNSLSTRAHVAQDLQSLIYSLKQERATCRIHIVAHSHAGNIAFYALRRPETSNAIASLICLSTPFLLIKARFESGRVSTLLRIGIASLVFALIFSAIVDGYFALTEEKSNGLIVTFISGIVAIVFEQWFRGVQMFHVKKLVETTDFPKRAEAHYQTLIIRAPSDEASIALASAQLVSKIITTLVGVLGLFVPSFYQKSHIEIVPSTRRRLRLLIAIIPFLAFCSITYDTVLAVIWLGNMSWDVFFRGLFGIVFFTASYWLVIVLFLMVTIGLAAIVVSVLLLPFGASLALYGWGLHVSAEASPPGEWPVVQLGASDDEGTNHATHSSATAIAVLEEWLRTKFGSR